MIVYEKEKRSSDCFFWQRFGDPDGGAFFTEIVILETKKGFVKKVYDWGFFKSEEIFTYNKPPLSWIINHLFTDTHRDKILSYYNPENITLKVPKTAILLYDLTLPRLKRVGFFKHALANATRYA